MTMEEAIRIGQDAPFKRGPVRLGLAWQIVIGLLLGVLLGIVLNHNPAIRDRAIADYLQPAGDLFIKLIKMVVIPIVFSSMVVGIAGVDDGKSLGRIGFKTLVYFEVITTIAIIFGLVIANVAKPGVGAVAAQVAQTDLAKLQSAAAPAGAHHGFAQLILNIVPDNLVAAMGRGDLLPVLFFALLFGLALQGVPRELREPVINTLRGVSDAMFRVTAMVMRYAPVGVAALIAITVANFGFGSLLPLLKLVLVTYAAIVLFTLVVLGITARLFGLRILSLLRIIKDELLIAFTTCSSATVLPQLIKKMEDFGCPKAITTFVVPTGYVFNLDGISIYLGIGTLFVAQIYGIHLGIQEQIVLVVTMAITSKGAAGVPGIIFVVMLATLSSAGLPLEGLALMAGVDRFMDMGRTALNVVGNALAPLVIAKWEGQYDAAKAQAYLNSFDRKAA